MSKIPEYDELMYYNPYEALYTKIKEEASQNAYKLIVKLMEYKNKLKLATTESLTAGLIMSTIVDIPIGGLHKYGCFGVYDTDAKRVFNSVTVEELYSHTCAKQLAIGMLKNSNASLVIAVSGNAMPYVDTLERLGEVFIGIAGYTSKGGKNKIVYNTTAINACSDNNNLCKAWVRQHKKKTSPGGTESWDYPKRIITSQVSRYVRYYTASKAYELCIDFMAKNDLVVPDFISIRQRDYVSIKDGFHVNVPKSKFEIALEEECKSSQEICKIDNTGERGAQIAELPKGVFESPTNNPSFNARKLRATTSGKRKKKFSKKKKK